MSKHSIQNDPEIQQWIENNRIKYLMKSHAIEFVYFVLSNPLYKDTFNPETDIEIYKEFLNQNKDE